jgi:Ca2+-binding RTX toxin-like protein
MATITGTTFNDVITEDDLIGAITGGIPSLLPDLIEAHGGNDVVDASGGNDTLYGGAGDDTLLGGEGNDILDSTTTTGAGNDLLMGGAGNDTLFAYGNDTIDGGEGDDLIRVWRDQAYTLQGGSGIDTVSISDSFWSIGATFSLEQNGIEIIDGMGREIRGDSVNNAINFSGVTLNRVKFIDLQEGEDTLIGSTGSIDVRGGQGNDSVTGSIDNDFLYGGTEDDTLIGGDGNDVLDADFYADGNEVCVEKGK